MDLRARGIRTFADAVALSLVLVGALAASAQAPVVAPAADHHAALGHHATTPDTEPASTTVFRDTKVAARWRALPRIRGTVGPGTTITVNRSQVVKGRYRIVVKDESAAHNWHITGPGDVSKKTSVSGTGKWVWRIRLRAGTYGIVCDIHPTTMNTSLRVTAD